MEKETKNEPKRFYTQTVNEHFFERFKESFDEWSKTTLKDYAYQNSEKKRVEDEEDRERKAQYEQLLTHITNRCDKILPDAEYIEAVIKGTRQRYELLCQERGISLPSCISYQLNQMPVTVKWRDDGSIECLDSRIHITDALSRFLSGVDRTPQSSECVTTSPLLPKSFPVCDNLHSGNSRLHYEDVPLPKISEKKTGLVTIQQGTDV